MNPISPLWRLLAVGVLLLPAATHVARAQQPRNLMDVIRQNSSTCDSGTQNCTPNAAGNTPGRCAPGDAGAVCNTSEPAVEGDAAGINTGAGNPINIITGNKYQREVDMPALPGVLGLELVRHYNSAFSRPTDANGIIGRGWRLSYETDLFVRGNSIHILQADGSRLIFHRDPRDPSTCANEDPARGRITIRDTPDGPDYTWTWSNGRKLNFNAQGRLVQILAPTGEFVSLQRAPNGDLLKVTDPQGRVMQLRYLDREAAAKNDRYQGVVAIDTPVGEYRYDYGSPVPKGSDINPRNLLATLVRVHLPASYDHSRKRSPHSDYGTTVSTVTRHYHHEDPSHPTLLTGISVVGTGSDGKHMNERISTYAYNTDGKAVMSVRGEPLRHDSEGKPVEGTGIEQVNLDRSEPGKTKLTNSLGQVTVYKHGIIGGMYRILEVFGPGCASCGETNVRYQYDKLGRLTKTIRLDHNGLPLAGVLTDYDSWGRKVRISRVIYRDGKPGRPEWLERYEYAVPRDGETPGHLPTLTARPSVIPGREYQVRVEYNGVGQPVRVTESGWAPTLENREPNDLTRITKFSYQQINGRSVLSKIEGPLSSQQAHTPINFDVTLIRHDARADYAVEINEVGVNRVIVAQRNTTGFPTRIEHHDDINPPRYTRLSYEPQGRYRTITSGPIEKGGATSISALLPNGTENLFSQVADDETDKQNRTNESRFRYDAIGRTTDVAALGMTAIRLKYDVADRVVELNGSAGSRIVRTFSREGTLLHKSSEFGPIEARGVYDYWTVVDNANRLRRIVGSDGRVLNIEYTMHSNRMSAVSDELGRRAEYRYDDYGRLVAKIQNPRELTETQTTLAYDEQLRESFTKHPHQKRRHWLGAVGEIITGHNLYAVSHQTQLYGLAATLGTEIDGYQSSRATVGATTFTSPSGTRTTFAIDDFGRTVYINGPEKGVVRAEFDAADRLKSILAADGSKTSYQYNRAGQIVERIVEEPGKGKGLRTEVVKFRYAGRLLKEVVSERQATLYQYDEHERIVKKTEIVNRDHSEDGLKAYKFTREYWYDGLGRLRSEVLPSGDSVRIEYSHDGFPQNIYLLDAKGKVINTLASEIRFRAPVGVAGFTHGNGLRTTVTFDRATNKVADLLVTASAKHGADESERIDRTPANAKKGETEEHVFLKQELSYDSAGRVVSVRLGGTLFPHASFKKLTYDKMDRLIKEEKNSEFSSWTYDGLGNRTSMTTSDGRSKDQSLSYQIRGAHLVAVHGADSTESYAYDKLGNVIQKGEYSFEYGPDGQLYEARKRDRAIAEYRYNAFGERVRKTVRDKRGEEQSTYFLYENNRIATEITGDGRPKVEYIYLADQLIARIDYTHGNEGARVNTWTERLKNFVINGGTYSKREVYAVHSDHMGTPVAMTNGARNVVWKADHETFGNAGVLVEGVSMNIRMPGQYLDRETGLHYNYFRYYDPTSGRYLQPDPIGIGGGLNPYIYVGSDPLNYSDRLGLLRSPSEIYRAALLEATRSRLPGPHNGLQDAFRHCFGSCEMSREYTVMIARCLGWANEKDGDWGRNQEIGEREMDDFNNAVGFELGNNAKTKDDCRDFCMTAVRSGSLRTYTPGSTPGYFEQ